MTKNEMTADEIKIFRGTQQAICIALSKITIEGKLPEPDAKSIDPEERQRREFWEAFEALRRLCAKTRSPPELLMPQDHLPGR